MGRWCRTELTKFRQNTDTGVPEGESGIFLLKDDEDHREVGHWQLPDFINTCLHYTDGPNHWLDKGAL